MIAVVACIEVVPGRRDDFLREFRKLVPQVRAEAGCLEYVPMLDLPTSIGGQSPVGENLVTVLEKWAHVEALEAHSHGPSHGCLPQGHQRPGAGHDAADSDAGLRFALTGCG